MTDTINPITAEVTILNRALGDKPANVCINPADELVNIDMAKLAMDDTPYTDIEAEMAKAKQPAQAKGQYDANVLLAYAQARLATRGETTQYAKVLKVSTLEDYVELETATAIFKAGFEDIDAFITKQPAPTTAILQEPATCKVCHGTIERGKKASIVPRGFIHYRSEPCQRTLEREHMERSRNTPTTAEFMDILNEISFQQFMASIPRVLCLPAPKPVEKPSSRIISPRKIDEWVKNSADNRATRGKDGLLLDMLDMVEAIALLRGKTPDSIVYLYLPRQIFGVPKREMFDTYRNVIAHYQSALHSAYARVALGDDGKARRL